MYNFIKGRFIQNMIDKKKLLEKLSSGAFWKDVEQEIWFTYDIEINLKRDSHDNIFADTAYVDIQEAETDEEANEIYDDFIVDLGEQEYKRYEEENGI